MEKKAHKNYNNREKYIKINDTTHSRGAVCGRSSTECALQLSIFRCKKINKKRLGNWITCAAGGRWDSDKLTNEISFEAFKPPNDRQMEFNERQRKETTQQMHNKQNATKIQSLREKTIHKYLKTVRYLANSILFISKLKRLINFSLWGDLRRPHTNFQPRTLCRSRDTYRSSCIGNAGVTHPIH